MAEFKLKRANSVRQPYYFTIVSPGNGQVLATSEMYTSKDGAINGMRAIIDALQGACSYDDET